MRRENGEGGQKNETKKVEEGENAERKRGRRTKRRMIKTKNKDNTVQQLRRSL